MTATTTDLFALAVLAAALAAAAIGDVRRYLIPNRYPAAIAAAYLLAALQHPIDQTLWGIGVGLLSFALGAALFAARVMGGGDVKLFAATALWAGPQLALPFVQVVAIAGAALGLLWLSPVRRLLPAAPGLDGDQGFRQRLREPVPYGLAIAIGGFYLVSIRALA